MRITRRQLIRIIKETHPDYQGLPQSDIDYYELADDYAMWVKENGHVTPAASSVMATYFLEKGLEDDHEMHEMLGKAFGIEHNDIMADIRRQETERNALIGEAKMKITKRQLRRIIKEERAKLLAENRVRKIVREALLKESKIDGGYPEEFGGTAGYVWVPPREVEVGDYVEVTTHRGQVVRGIALKHGDDSRGGPYISSAEKTWDGRVKRVNGQIHMKTEPDAKGRGGGTNEFVDFPIPRNSRMVIKKANPGYQQQSLGL